MRRYKVVHTGAKIKEGGLNQGLLIDAYQVGMLVAVTWPAIKPSTRGSANKKSKTGMDLRVMV